MTFVIKQKYVAPHFCDTPPQTQNKPLVPGDVWKCDECGRHYVWALYYGKPWWSWVSERQANKRLKRHLKGKPPKRRHEGTGPG